MSTVALLISLAPSPSWPRGLSHLEVVRRLLSLTARQDRGGGVEEVRGTEKDSRNSWQRGGGASRGWRDGRLPSPTFRGPWTGVSSPQAEASPTPSSHIAWACPSHEPSLQWFRLTPPLSSRPVFLCGGDVTGESGYVASEGFPNLYPPNKKCIWTITVRRPLWSPLLFISLPSQTLTAQGYRPHHQASPLGNPLFLFGPRVSGPMVTCSEVLQPSSSWSNPTTGN